MHTLESVLPQTTSAMCRSDAQHLPPLQRMPVPRAHGVLCCTCLSISLKRNFGLKEGSAACTVQGHLTCTEVSVHADFFAPTAANFVVCVGRGGGEVREISEAIVMG